jgi:hypothetical protein
MMANKPGKSMSHMSHERLPFQIKAVKVRIPATTPAVIVRKPEKCRDPVVTEINSTTNKIISPADHQPSFVWGFSKKWLEVVFITHLQLHRSTQAG